jgi:hypothetical protein
MEFHHFASCGLSIAKREWETMIAIPTKRFEEGGVLSSVEIDAVDVRMSQLARCHVPVVAVDDGHVGSTDDDRRPVTLRHSDGLEVIPIELSGSQPDTRSDVTRLHSDNCRRRRV